VVVKIIIHHNKKASRYQIELIGNVTSLYKVTLPPTTSPNTAEVLARMMVAAYDHGYVDRGLGKRSRCSVEKQEVRELN
jgi:hypothetical protein